MHIISVIFLGCTALGKDADGNDENSGSTYANMNVASVSAGVTHSVQVVMQAHGFTHPVQESTQNTIKETISSNIRQNNRRYLLSSEIRAEDITLTVPATNQLHITIETETDDDALALTNKLATNAYKCDLIDAVNTALELKGQTSIYIDDYNCVKECPINKKTSVNVRHCKCNQSSYVNDCGLGDYCWENSCHDGPKPKSDFNLTAPGINDENLQEYESVIEQALVDFFTRRNLDDELQIDDADNDVKVIDVVIKGNEIYLEYEVENEN